MTAPYELRVAGPAARASPNGSEAVAVAVVESITARDWRIRTGSARNSAGPLEGLFAARRGTYRVVFEVDGERQIVTVRDVDHRSDAYRHR